MKRYCPRCEKELPDEINAPIMGCPLCHHIFTWPAFERKADMNKKQKRKLIVGALEECGLGPETAQKMASALNSALSKRNMHIVERRHQERLHRSPTLPRGWL